MDRIKALGLENELKGKLIKGWEILNLIDNGKSAAVFKAVKNGEHAAVKIFDDELIEKYGDTVQIKRIEREISLIGKSHENLIKIMDGGVDPLTNNHFIIMEYLNGANLKKGIHDIKDEDIPLYVSQLASAAHFLEEHDLCHRDIKPENIIVNTIDKKLTLLDLGVIRPFGQSGLTDDDGIHNFIGTLQYSSPEFLLRNEKDTVEGWRALTFYQIGAVLHDLIMKRPIFSEYETPYAKLVNAVQHIDPEIQSNSVPRDVVEIAKCCLLKKPEHRLILVNWERLLSLKEPHQASSAKARVTTRIQLKQALSTSEPTSSREATHHKETLEAGVISILGESARSIRNDNRVFPPLSSSVDGKKISIHFDKSESHGLGHLLKIVFAVEILDAVAKAISIEYSCSYGELKLASSKILFSGIHDGEKIYAELEDTLYELLDLAQTSHQ